MRHTKPRLFEMAAFVLTAPAFELGQHVIYEGFTGAIDELRIYDGALQLPQIQALAAGRACP